MKIAKRYRPELVCSQDKERPNLLDPYLDAKASRLVATDGRAMVALPVETDKGERSRYLACSLLRAARGLGDSEVPAEIEDQEIVEFGVLWPTAQERTFPEWEKLVPGYREGDPGTVSISLNPRLLKNVADAMHSGSGVTLTFDPQRPNEPIVVRPVAIDPQEVGLLMPLRAGDDEETKPGQKCPKCGKLLAAGAPCPEHGAPLVPALAEAAERVQKAAAAIDGGGATVTIRVGGKEVTATPAQIRAGLAELDRRKKAAGPTSLTWTRASAEVHCAVVPTGRYEIQDRGNRYDVKWFAVGDAKGVFVSSRLERASAEKAARDHYLDAHGDRLLANAGSGEMTKRDLKGDATTRKSGGSR